MLKPAKEKFCSVCEAVKPPEEFHKRAASADGLMSACKDCCKARDRARYAGEKERRAERQREYMKTPEGAAARAKAMNTWRSKNKKKMSAHNKVNKAIMRGNLVAAASCEQCGSADRIEGHHDDYDKPLDVRWLCYNCHAQWHRENEALNGD